MRFIHGVATTMLLLGSATHVVAASLPSMVYLDNFTAYTVDGYTAGQPGARLTNYSSNFGVPYLGVITRCNLGGTPEACPIEFYNNENHELMASVLIDIWQAKVIAAPVLYGKYRDELAVKGWEEVPFSHITLYEKG